MNKYQKVIIISGFILIILTLVYGSSRFQADINYDPVYKGFSRSKFSSIEQRIKPSTLMGILILEIGGIIFLAKILRSKKEGNSV